MAIASSQYPAPLARTLDASETWKPVPGFEGRYEVSDQGRVWSAVTNRILRAGPTSRGYLTVNLYFNERPKRCKSFCVHDLVAAAFIGPKPERQQVDHIDANKLNNAAVNLRYLTQSDNIRHAVKLGRVQYHGHEHFNAKLSAEQVREIRAMAGQFSRQRIASEYGVSYSLVCNVLAGRTYRNVS